jgi:adenosylhomocysteine nucleosidase
MARACPPLVGRTPEDGGLKDVKLGDVVAATKVYFYESGKDNAEFQPRVELCESSYALVQRAIAVASASRWVERIGGEFQQGPLPSAIVKPLVAGGKVVASHRAQSFEILRKHYSDAAAVDMESYGFLRATYSHSGIQSLAVRGISDLIENKSESDAQGGQLRAAAHSAAFVFQVLAELNPAPAQTERLPGNSSVKEIIDGLERIAVELYPLGPVDSQVWSRAGGDVSRITLTGKGHADWHSALQILRNGGGGTSLTIESLIAAMKSDFPSNPTLTSL